MLVLNRKPGERVVIGNNIVVTVLEIRSGHVKLGIECPHHVAVHREEVHRRIHEAQIHRSSAHSAKRIIVFRRVRVKDLPTSAFQAGPVRQSWRQHL